MTSPPPIVPRAAWGANPNPTPAGTIAVPTAELWLHHTASTGLHGPAGMRALQANAIRGGYADLEYTFIVDNPTPTIYESRGPGRNTAATYMHNERSSALCVMGNFQGPDHPSQPLVDTLAQLVAFGHERGWWPAQITGPHRAASGNSTACCGDNLVAKIGEINQKATAGPAPSPPPAPGPVPPPVARPVLRVGSRGPAVSTWQTLLNRYAGQHLVVDGIFGNNTDTSTRNFQRFFGLTVDGIVGPKTWGMMDYLVAHKR